MSKDSSLTYAEPASAPLPIAQRLYDCGRCINLVASVMFGHMCEGRSERTCARGILFPHIRSRRWRNAHPSKGQGTQMTQAERAVVIARRRKRKAGPGYKLQRLYELKQAVTKALEAARK